MTYKEKTLYRQIGTTDHAEIPVGRTASMGYVDPKKVWIDEKGMVYTTNPRLEE